MDRAGGHKPRIRIDGSCRWSATTKDVSLVAVSRVHESSGRISSAVSIRKMRSPSLQRRRSSGRGFSRDYKDD